MKSKGTYAKKQEQKMESEYKDMSGKTSKGKHLKKGNRKVAIIAICAILAVVIVGLVAGYFVFYYNIGNTVLKNVTVAGMDIGGMTKEEALATIKKVANESYLNSDMVVEAFGKSLALSPADTQIALDAEGAVSAAYDFGRTGFFTKWQKERLQASTVGYTVDLTPYLTVNSEVIKNAISDFIAENQSSLTQSTWEVVGTRPNLSEKSSEKGQTLAVQLGTPAYVCDTESFYQQVMDAYNQNCFQFSAKYDATLPDALDLPGIWNSTTVQPTDATQDPQTLKVTKETYGYGFNLENATEKIQEASYGSKLEFPFEYIAPAVTQVSLMEEYFGDELSTYTAKQNSDTSRATNLRLACEAINDIILFPGDEFSYNNILGERTEEKGYLPGPAYVGNATTDLVGGGICQVASTLYYCALYADLEILERECHQFTTVYSPLGVDATVSYGALDFRFRNNSEHPILIKASASGGSTTVTFYGIDDKDYYIKMESEVLKKYPYTTLYADKTSEGFREGAQVVTPYTGYDVKTYRCKYSKATDELISKEFEADSDYKKRDAVICRVKKPSTSGSSSNPSSGSSALQGSGGSISDSGGALPPED